MYSERAAALRKPVIGWSQYGSRMKVNSIVLKNCLKLSEPHAGSLRL